MYLHMDIRLHTYPTTPTHTGTHPSHHTHTYKYTPLPSHPHIQVHTPLTTPTHTDTHPSHHTHTYRYTPLPPHPHIQIHIHKFLCTYIPVFLNIFQKVSFFATYFGKIYNRSVKGCNTFSSATHYGVCIHYSERSKTCIYGNLCI